MSVIERFRGAPARHQIAFVALGVAALAGVLIAAYFLWFRTPYAVLFSNLRTMDAATIVASLEKKKVAYRLDDGGTTILVPEKQVDGARLSVMSEDLPLKGMVGFELFNKSDMGLTEFAQKINYQRALQGELARTIMAMDTVDTARVHLSITEPTVFRGDRRPPKASVTVIPRTGMMMSANTVEGIQRLVAAAVPDLNVANVVVLNDRGEVVSSAAVEVPTSPDLQQRQAVEQFYAATARQALARLYPDIDVEVTVHARLAAAADFDPYAAEHGTASGDGAGSALDGWTPDARRFPLSVSVTTESVSAELMEEFRTVAGEAVGLNSALGDVVTVMAAKAPVGPTSPSARGEQGSEPAAVQPRDLFSPAGFWQALLVPVFALLLVVAFLVHRYMSPQRRPSGRKREDYVSRFKVLLEKEDANASL